MKNEKQGTENEELPEGTAAPRWVGRFHSLFPVPCSSFFIFLL
jgi:hypothetical protein